MSLQGLLSLITAHTCAAYTIIFLISLSESLALVGLLVPGTVLMFGVGAVIGTGVLSLRPALVLAMAGAILGDGISYWLGRYHHGSIRTIGPFRRHPDILSRGIAFFQRHGGKSVLLGRFVGPLRPVIPLVAGMLGMPSLRFAFVNILSAIGWAVAYLLPGVLFGTSLTVAGQISARLAVLLAVVVCTIWAVLFLFRKLFLLAAHAGNRGIERLEAWIGSHAPARGTSRSLKRFLAFLFFRQKGEEYLLAFLVAVLFTATWGFLEILHDVLIGTPLVRADRAVYHFLQALRNPWADRIFAAITELGDGLVNAAVAAAVFITLLVRRRYRTAGYWVTTLIGGALLVRILKWSFHLERPVHLFHGISAFGFPSGHTTMSVVLYGFLAILVAKRLGNAIRLGLLGAVLAATSTMAFSRLYLGAHWLSDVLGGYLLALVWTALAGLGYLRGQGKPIPRRLLGLITIIVFSVVGYWHVSVQHSRDLLFYAPRHAAQTMAPEAWLRDGWKDLPSWRIDLGGEKEQPMTLQWAGSPETLEQLLVSRGWEHPPASGLRTYLGMLSPDMGVHDLPLLPHLHDGRFERVLLLRKEGAERLVFRLWSTDFRIADRGESLWVGTVETQRAIRVAGLMTLPNDQGDYLHPLGALYQALRESSEVLEVNRDEKEMSNAGPPERPLWNGRVLLARERSGHADPPK